MKNSTDCTSESERFERYLGRLSVAISFSQRHERLGAYVAGLMLPGDRKSVEPMAAMIEPAHASAQHQAMHHFVAKSDWSDAALLHAAYDEAIGPMTSHGPIEHWIIDDSGMPKSGEHSVGVIRQYCGATGKKDNCQVAVSLSVCNGFSSLPVGYRLYLPESWTRDPERLRLAGVPPEIVFQKKWEIALDLIDQALASGKPNATVLADAGYGDATAFRDALTARHLTYVVGIQTTITVWPPGKQPLPPKPYGGWGRPPGPGLRHGPEHQPMSVVDFAKSLPPETFQEVAWRAGTRGTMISRFAAVRIRPAHGDHHRAEPRPEEWLLIEWPAKEPDPTKFWLSTLEPSIPMVELVRKAKERWHIERDYQELKDELGLDHYEGRNWRGFHHHASLCIAAFAFLVAERSRFSPLSLLRRTLGLQIPPVPANFRRRGSPETRTASTHVNHDFAATDLDPSQPTIAAVSDLPAAPGGTTGTTSGHHKGTLTKHS